MKNLTDLWNKSASTIPFDKNPSGYAIAKEKLFPRNAVVCDLGGSTGADSLYFIKQGHKVTLVDISDFALQVAQDKAKKFGLENGLVTLKTDFSEGRLPLENDNFDIVFSGLALHYFPSKRLCELFTEVYRILKSHGTAYITLKSPNDLEEMQFLKKTAKGIEKGVFDDKSQVKTRFTKQRLKEILKETDITDFEVNDYIENFEGRKDRVKSGKDKLLLNEVILKKSLLLSLFSSYI
jgi:ubiquinone/menaquinone biosynthesis C-methylase UbiE